MPPSPPASPVPPDLPVAEVADRIRQCVAADHQVVISAPAGSGKTTQVPQIILTGCGIEGRIVVLQPRRLATRMVANRVAAEVGCRVGTTVGYQTRHEKHVSSQTRIEFLTEGIMLRHLLADLKLPGVGAVILDEFHERSVNLDMVLGLLRDARRQTRPDLKLLVMSATLDVEKITTYLECPVVETSGRTYPIDISYQPKHTATPIWDQAAVALADQLATDQPGDVLIFMPGSYEIRRTIDACRRSISSVNEQISYLPLHGSLSPKQQDAVMRESSARKVIVSTNIAQTSITIDGIRHVIDSGLARVPRYDGQRGLNVLLPEAISQAAADQRAGRAGRTAPGTCMRLWTQTDQRNRDAHDTPEVHRIDLSGPLLQLRAAGVTQTQSFDWLEPPSKENMARADRVLHALNAIDEAGQLTATGKRMADLPTHPRVARMLVESAARGCMQRASKWAAIIGERNIMLGQPPAAFAMPDEDGRHSDLLVLERLLAEAASANFDRPACDRMNVNANACREIDRVATQLHRIAAPRNRGQEKTNTDERTEDLLKCLLAAMPDHVAVKHDADRPHCAMPGRKRVTLDKRSVVSRPGPIIALDVREVGAGSGVKTALSMANEIDAVWLSELFSHRVNVHHEPQWNDASQAVEAVEQLRFGELVLQQTRRPTVDPETAADMLVDRVISGDLRMDKWDDQVEQWIARTRFVAEHDPKRGLIQYDEDDQRVILHEIVSGATRYNQIRSRPCLSSVINALSWEDQQWVEKMAPVMLPLPSGARLKIDYTAGDRPRGRAKIQQLFDLRKTPMIAGGRHRLLLEILGPNYRPVQITDDLENFWEVTYPQLAKELKRRYPKHEWR